MVPTTGRFGATSSRRRPKTFLGVVNDEAIIGADIFRDRFHGGEGRLISPARR